MPSVLETEIDASLSVLDGLDDSPTGTSLPEFPHDRPPSTVETPSKSAGGAHPQTLRMATDPAIGNAPQTVRGGTEGNDAAREEAISVDLESTHSGPKDDEEEEIVIADDFAEIVEDGKEITDAGGSAPPYRPEG
jgi:hypothetical protein